MSHEHLPIYKYSCYCLKVMALRIYMNITDFFKVLYVLCEKHVAG